MRNISFKSALAVLFAVVFCAPASAQVVRNFDLRYQADENGEIFIVGNTLMTCPSSDPDCANAHAGIGADLDNFDFVMEFVDIDGNGSTFNSSSADFTLPAGASVLWAGLYWGGRSDDGSRGTVLLQTPTSGGYLTRNSSVLDSDAESYYAAFVDVTADVTAAGTGTYTVANVQAFTGANRHAGWSLVVVVSDLNSPLRSLRVFDGFARVTTSTPSVDMTVSGLLVPPSGAVNTLVGQVVYEGDLGITGDEFRINGTPVGDALNPTTNFFNSSITRLASHVTSKNPDWVNQLGFDANFIDVSTFDPIPNGATGATLTFTTSGDWYWPSVAAFETDLFAPEIDPNIVKAVQDLNAGNPEPGDTLLYTISVENTGSDAAISTVLSDTIPSFSTYVPGSMQVISGANVGPKTDATGDDQADFLTGPNRVLMRLGTGADDTNGGRMAVGETTSVSFRVVIDIGTPGGTDIVNSVTVDYVGESLGFNFSGTGNVVTTSVVDAVADLVALKTGPSTVDASGSVVYSIVVRNDGPSRALDVDITDTLPPAATFVSATDGGVESGGSVTWPTIPVLAAGDSVSYSVTVQAPATGTLTNVLSASSPDNDPDSSNNDGSAAASRVVTTVTEQADVVVLKTGPATANAGSNIVYTVTVRNDGPSDATSVDISDALPAGSTFVSASDGGSESAGTVTWPTVATLAAADSVVYTVTVAAPLSGTAINVASATASTADPDTGNNDGSDPTSQVSTTISEQADVVVLKSGPASALAGSNIVYSVTVRNDGPSVATSIDVADALPTGSTFVSATAGGSEAAGVVSWPTVATLAAGDSVVYGVTIVAPASGPALNVASATAATGDPDDSNNDGSDPSSQVSTTITEQADVVALKSGPPAIAASGVLNYTVTIRNDGPSDAADVVITDDLPSNATFVSASDGGTEAAGVVTWPTVASLAAGDSVVYSVAVTPPPTGTMLNVVSASASTGDPDAGNNDGSDSASQVSTTVLEIADLVVLKTGPATADAGSNLAYTVTVRNDGPSVAASVDISDALPTGSTFVSASDGGTESAGVVTWPTVASIAAGDSVVYTLTVVAPAAGTALNVASATSTTIDSDAGNNDGSDPASQVSTVITEQADLVVLKSGPTTANSLDTVVYTITVRNDGPSEAPDVDILDALPSNATFQSASNGGSEAGGTVTWPTVPSIAAGDSVSYTVTVTAPVSGTMLNTASASTSAADPNVGNNDGSDPASQVTTLVSQSADVVALKSGPASVGALGTVVYSITVRNDGPSDAADVDITDTLPAGATFVSASDGGIESGGTVTWPTVGTLAAADSVVYSITVTAPTSGTLLNTVAATSATPDPDAGNNDGSDPASQVSTIVSTSADVVALKTGPNGAFPSTDITYTLTVRNDGPSDAANVAVTDSLPSTGTFVGASDGGLEASGVVTWPIIPTLAAGDSVVYSVTVNTPTTGTLVNVVLASSSTADPDPSNNDGSASESRVITAVPPESDLAILKSGPAAVGAGQNIVYSIVVQNNGPSDATGVDVTDTLPPGVTFVSASDGGIESGGVVTWPTIPLVPFPGFRVLTLTVTAPSTGTLVNVASGTGIVDDPDLSNNDGSDPASRVTTLVTQTADVVALKSGPAAVTAADTVSYTITIRNDGPENATDIDAVDALPAGATFLDATGGGVESGGTVNWPTIASLAAGDSVVYTLRVLPPASGTLLNVVSATSGPSTVDPDLGNNDGSDPASQVSTTVGEVADVVALKTGPAQINTTGTLDYVLTVRNDGPSDAVNVDISDPLPVGTTFDSASDGGSLDVNVVRWPTIPSLAAGDSVVYTLRLLPSAVGTVTNVLTASSSTADPDPANNDGSDPASRVVTNVQGLADVVTLKTAPATIDAGDTLTYDITVRNDGPSDAVDVDIVDTLPPTASFVDASDGGLEAGGDVTWPQLASLDAGDSVQYTVRILAPGSGVLLNIVAATTTGSFDPDASNNDGSDPSSQASTTIVENADLVVLKSGPVSVAAADTIRYRVVVRNAGPSDADNVDVTDTLPPAVTFESASDGGTEAGGIVSWPTVATLSAGDSLVYDLVVVAPAITTTVTNVARATSTTPDPATDNNNGNDPASQVVTAVTETADVVVLKTGPAVVDAGGSVAYTITARNDGPSPASLVDIADDLPAGASFVSASNGGSESAGVVTWPTLASLAVGDSVVYTLTVTAPGNGPMLNIARVNAASFDPDASNNDGSDPASQVTTAVNEIADVVVLKSGPATVNAAETFSYSITVRNDGPSAANDVDISDLLPPAATFVSATDGGSVAGPSVVWPTIASLAAGDSVVYGLTVQAPTTGSLLNVASATTTTTDPNAGNNDGSDAASQVSTTVVESADLISIKTGPAVVAPSDTLNYSITVRNDGPSAAADVVAQDNLPAGVTFLAANAGGTEAGGVVSWPPVASLAAGDSLVFTVTALAPSVEGIITNRASASSSTSDPDPTNNDGSTGTSVLDTNVAFNADVVASKTGPTFAAAGDTVTYGLTVRNDGPSDAEDVVIVDDLPANLAFLTASDGGVLAAGSVTWPTIPSLAVGDSVVYSLQGLAPDQGTLLNVVSSTATTLDPDVSNNDGSSNSSRVSTTVQPRADVVVFKSGPATLAAADTLDYRVTARNDGPSAAIDVTVVDDLPANVTFIGASGGGILSGSQVTWPVVASLAAGDSVVYTLQAMAPPVAGTAVNVASATANTIDPDLGNNDGSDVASRVATTITGAPDLALTKAPQGAFLVGQQGVYAFTVNNLGTDLAAGSFTVVDSLPPGLSFASGAGTGWAFSTAGSAVTATHAAPLQPSETTSFTLTVDIGPAAAPSVTNVAVVSAALDADPTNDRATAPTPVGGVDLAMAKRPEGEFTVGAPGTFVLTVSNVGTSATTAATTVVDSLPVGLVFQSADAPGWTVTSDPPLITAVNTGALAPGDSSLIRINVIVEAAAEPSVVNSARASTDGDEPGDPNYDNNTTTTLPIPVNPAAGLFIEKSVSPRDAEIADVVDYTVRVQNIGVGLAPDVQVDDRLPTGFRMVPGTARIDGVSVADPVGTPGPQLTFDVGGIAGGATLNLSYRVEIGPGAQLGDGINRVTARSLTTGEASNEARAGVRVRGGVFTDEAMIFGKVYSECDCAEIGVQNSEDLGIPGVRVYLQDGTSAVTDREGKYHFFGVSPRTHIVRIDQTTLPAGAKLIPMSNRNLGDGHSVWADVKKGEMFRVDFAEHSGLPSVVQEIKQRRMAGPVLEAAVDAAPGSILPQFTEEGASNGSFTRVPPRRALTDGNSALPADPAHDETRWTIHGDGQGGFQLLVPRRPLAVHGGTQVPVRVRLFDASGEAPRDASTLTLETDFGRWLVEDEDDRAPGVQVTVDGGQAEFHLEAPSRVGAAHVRVTRGWDDAQEATIDFLPVRRSLVAMGLLEARLDWRSLTNGELGTGRSRDRFEDELKDWSLDSSGGQTNWGARGAMFLKGTVDEHWDVTLRYDSEKDPRRRLFRDIRPDELYSLYGDASARHFEAQSTDRLYLRLQRDRSWFTYGDFQTSLTLSGARTLGSYSRSLRGGVSRLESAWGTVTAFASHGRSAQQVDELAGQGISGPYELSRSDGLLNSERVEILTRDRNQPSIILKTQTQARFADYTIEPFSRRLMFKRPVPSVDENLNPISIRVTYELEGGGDKLWVYGVDGSVKPTSRLEIGASALSDEDSGGLSELLSARASVGITGETFLSGEIARSDSANTNSGTAGRIELSHQSSRVSARAFYVRTETDFYNPSAGVARGRSEAGLRARGALSDKTRVLLDALRTESLANGGEREGLSLGLEHVLSPWFNVEAGFRRSYETAAPASPRTTGATPHDNSSLRGRATYRFPFAQGASAFGEFEQDVGSTDQKRFALGGDYRLTVGTRLYGRYELINSFDGTFALNQNQRQYSTVFGLSTDVVRDSYLFTEYRARDAFNGRETQAAIGLRNRWPLGEGVRLDTSLERIAPLRGSSGVEATAITAAVSATGSPLWKGSARAEYRHTPGTDSYLATLGYARKLSRDWSLLGRSSLSIQANGPIYERSQLGFAYRQTHANRWNLLARYENKFERSNDAFGARSERLAHVVSAHVNFQPSNPVTMRGQVAGKYASLDSGGDTFSQDATLLALRTTYDLSPVWDLGLTTRSLFRDMWKGHQSGLGLEVGRLLTRNLRLSAGYNVFGFHDEDLAGEDATDHGWYLNFGFKFDESIFGSDGHESR